MPRFSLWHHRWIFLIGAVFGVVLGIGLVLSSAWALRTYDPLVVDSASYQRALSLIQQEYLFPNRSALAAQRGLEAVLAVDPHSRYFSPKAFAIIAKDMENSESFGGIGLVFQQRPQDLLVQRVLDNSPAARAGIQEGDRIVGIDHRLFDPKAMTDLVAKMRGPVGSIAVVGVVSPKTPIRWLSVQRILIHPESASLSIVDHVGIIRLPVFYDTAGQDIAKILQQLSSKRIAGIVLDLRNNPGGLVNSAVSVAGDFLPPGPIVSIEERHKPNEVLVSTSGDLTKNLPMVVLIDGMSASASEIVAGALQDRHRAVVIGHPSFGKGSVQQIFSLPNGGAASLTVGRYYTPLHRSIQSVGIVPDITLPLLDSEKTTREADLEGALSAEPSPHIASIPWPTNISTWHPDLPQTQDPMITLAVQAIQRLDKDDPILKHPS